MSKARSISREEKGREPKEKELEMRQGIKSNSELLENLDQNKETEVPISLMEEEKEDKI